MPTEMPPSSGRPSRRTLGWLVGGVLGLHVSLLSSLTGTLDWRLPSDASVRVAPMQTRWIPPTPVSSSAPKAPAPAKPRTRVATEPKPVSKPIGTDTPPANAEVSVASMAAAQEVVPEPITPPGPSFSEAASSQTPASEPTSTPNTSQATDSTVAPAIAAHESLPPIPLGALPPPVLLSYRLTGQEKGLNYHAHGELRWQHNETAYALNLSVKAFLAGSRHWRSLGKITSAGLAPTRFSDSWRNERAAHFDRANKRVVFSNNAPVAALGPGAQDQISLYVQLAAAMAGDPQRFEPGTRLQIQTATLKDALPWLLTMETAETLTVGGQDLSTFKWVCQPRNRFDAKVEFWVSSRHAWMPVRIRITQVNGSFIDLVLSAQEPLPPLPTEAVAG
jgi:hypothetical protein